MKEIQTKRFRRGQKVYVLGNNYWDAEICTMKILEYVGEDVTGDTLLGRIYLRGRGGIFAIGYNDVFSNENEAKEEMAKRNLSKLESKIVQNSLLKDKIEQLASRMRTIEIENNEYEFRIQNIEDKINNLIGWASKRLINKYNDDKQYIDEEDED